MQEPSAAALKVREGRLRWRGRSWSKVEIFRFGPICLTIVTSGVLPARSEELGLRQIEDVLAKTDESVTALAMLAAKSVALQGVPALEYLLYGDGADGLAKGGDDTAFRCRSPRASPPILR